MNIVRFSRIFLALFGSTLLVIALLLSLFPFGAQAKPELAPASVIRYVSPTGDDAGNVCTSNASPCRTVQHAIDVSQDGDEIRVATGTYTGTMREFIPEWGNYATATVVVTKNIASLLGGYSSDFTSRNPNSAPTILSAAASPGDWVIFITGTTTLIDGFTVMGSDGSNVSYGAGIRVNGGAPTLNNNRVQGNNAPTWGGGIYVTNDASPTISGNRIYSNTAGEGAGIYVVSGSPLITGNLIISNVATAGYGGGIYVLGGAYPTIVSNTIMSNITLESGSGGAGISVRWGGQALIRNNLIAYNHANSEGGGIRVGNYGSATIVGNDILSNTSGERAGGVEVSNSGAATITGNHIKFNAADGFAAGGIFVDNSIATVISNEIVANVAPSGWGGAIRVDNSLAMIASNVITANSAAGAAGISFSSNSTATVDANTIAGNIGDPGGLNIWGGSFVTATNNLIFADGQGVDLGDDTTQVRLVNNTIADNLSEGILTNNASTLLVRNNIIARNNVGIHNGYGAASITLDHNDVWGNSWLNFRNVVTGTTDISTDPLFVDVANGDYHIRFGSPAMNTGTNLDAPVHDKDGVVRPQMGRVDMGAYEVVAPYSVYLPTVLK